MSSPRWTRTLLRLAAPPDRVEDVLGDLEEAHRDRVERRGPWLAHALTGVEALDMAVALIRGRVRGRGPGDGSMGRGGSMGGGRWSDLRLSLLDLKLGARMLIRYPGLTLVGGLAIAFAIWVGAGTFEFMTQVVRPTLPLEEGDRVVGIRLRDARTGGVEKQALHDFLTWREDLRSVEELGAFRTLERNLITGGERGEPVQVAEITASGFRVARVPPLLGRSLVETDEHPAASPVIVLGHEVWRTRFGSDPDVVGRTVHLGRSPATVVGVMPPGFAFPVSHDVWVPLRGAGTIPEPRRGAPIDIFGRLASGASFDEARAELATLGRRAAADSPETHEHLRPEVLPYARSVTGFAASLPFPLLLGANAFLVMLLVLVCGNVALLMFARASTREGEIAIRSALGAGRGRIVGQLFAEALVLGAVAAVAGLAAMEYGIRLGLGVVRSEILEGGRLPFWFDPGLSPTTVLYAAALTVLAAIVAGVVPGMKVTGRRVQARLKQTSAGSGGLRFGGIWTAIIVSQVAVTVSFPATAYFLRTAAERVRSLDVGFPEEQYLAVRLEMDREESAATPGDVSGDAFRLRFGEMVRELEERLEADPTVSGVTFAARLPRMYHPWKQVEVDEGAVPPPDERGHRVSNAEVATDYLDVLGTAVLAGRGFDSGDVEAGARVVLANQSFVDRVLGGRNAVGRRIRYVDADWSRDEARSPEDWYEIVGVVPDMGMTSGYGVAGLYHPTATGGIHPGYLALQVKGDPASYAARVREAASAVDPGLRLYDLQPMDQLANNELRFYQFWFRLVMMVSGIALLLSLTGIYSVLAFTVSRRTREIGVRIALGAPARRVVVAIFARPLTQVGAGVLVGAGVTAFITLAIYGRDLSATQALMVVGYAILMMGVCMLACIVPTRRALRVEPTEALRANE